MAEYIDRQAAIEKIRYQGIYGSGFSDEEREDDVVDMIESIPAADVRPVVRGEWEESADQLQAIRVKTCGNDWVTDCDATLTADKVRGFALDSEGVKVYSRERDIHGDYDNIYVPYSNLEALVFYFNEPLKEET